MTERTFRLLFMSTPIGPLGSGLGGGVELTLFNAAKAMIKLGHNVEIVAPTGSYLENMPITEIPGQLQISAQTQNRTDPILTPDNSVLANMWNYAKINELKYDIIMNFSYDWLPLYLTPFFNTPIAHLISMSSLTNTMDTQIEKVINQFPGTIAVHGKTQALSFSFGEKIICISNGLDISQYNFCQTPDSCLAWVGRISSEKGLEDAFAAAEITQIPLKIFGLKQDESYWEKINQDYPNAPVEYGGFLSTSQLQNEVGKCRGMLVTPRWIEAYPNVMLEALACGVPLIAYQRGGLSEIVENGKTGWLVVPDSVSGLVEAIAKLDQINRLNCRQQAESQYSLKAMGMRLENWFDDILNNFKNNK